MEWEKLSKSWTKKYSVTHQQFHKPQCAFNPLMHSKHLKRRKKLCIFSAVRPVRPINGFFIHILCVDLDTWELPLSKNSQLCVSYQIIWQLSGKKVSTRRWMKKLWFGLTDYVLERCIGFCLSLSVLNAPHIAMLTVAYKTASGLHFLFDSARKLSPLLSYREFP
jgi:hypothetical protein